MSSEALKEAKRDEWDLNSYQAKQGVGRKSDSSMSRLLGTQKQILIADTGAALESGVDEMVEKRFPHTSVKAGPEVDARGSNRQPLPEEEGGSRDDRGR